MRRYFNQRVQILDTNGDPVPGAKLEFFEAGTSNQLDTYSDFDLSTPNTNPVICDSGGYANIFLKKNRLYDYTTTDANDVTIYPKQLNVSSYEPPLTTKGDIFTFDTDFQRLAVGSDGLYLKADSSQATGLVWDSASDATLTTKGDLYTYDTGNARLPVGNDGDILVVDSSEATGLKWIAVPKFSVYLASPHSMTGGAYTKVVFDTETYDTASGFATGTFTIPAGLSGWWLFNSVVSIDNTSDQQGSFMRLYKNGSVHKYVEDHDNSHSGTQDSSVGGAVLDYFTAGDTIDIYVYTVATVNNLSGSEKTWFSGTRIAAA